MRRRLIRGALLGAWIALHLLIRLAWAEGPGLLLGERIVVHPGLSTELRYDSNVFFSNGRLGDGLPASAFILRILPSVDISTLSLRKGGLTPHKIDFRFHAGIDYKEYLTPNTAISQHRAVGVDLGGLVSLFPRSAFGLEFYDNYLRTNQPPFSFNPYNFDRDTNVFGIRARYSPGGQRLTLSLVYELGFDGYEDVTNGPTLSQLDLIYNTLTLRGSWKFLPKTALFVEMAQGVYSYLQPDPNLRAASYPLRASVGVLGLITQKLAVNLQAGYGNGFYTVGPSPSTAVVSAEVKYKPTFLATATLNYKHDFANSLVGSYFDLDAISLSYSHLIYRVTVLLHLTWERMAFQGSDQMLVSGGVCQNGEVTPCVAQTDRVDNYFSFDFKAEMPIRDWLLPSLGYSVQSNLSNGYTVVRTAITPVSYTKHEGWVRLAVRY